MSASSYLQGACVWKGAEMVDHPRWLREFPSAVLDAIDRASKGVAHLDWRVIDRENFPLPGCEAFFDDVRAELESGCGMVRGRVAHSQDAIA